jgi:cytidylate kinase
VPAQAGGSAEEFRRATEKVLCARAATGSGVILGRGGVILLREDLRVLRVRLDGPPRARVEQAMRIEGVDERTAERRRRRLDRTHEAYARHFYGVDLRDPALYHVVLDPTALGIETSVEMLVAAVGALGGRGDGSSPPGQRVAL